MTNFDYYFRGVANCLALLLWINISYPAGRPFGCGRCKSERTLISQLGASLSCLSIWIGFECGRKSHDESPVIEYDECSGGSKGSRSSSQWSLSESEVNWQLCGANGLSLERNEDSQRKSTSLISAYQFRRGALLGVASRPTPYVCLINVDCKQRSTSKVSSTRGVRKGGGSLLFALGLQLLDLGKWVAVVVLANHLYGYSTHCQGIKHLGFLQSCAAQIFALKHNSQCSNKTHTTIEGIFTNITSPHTHTYIIII